MQVSRAQRNADSTRVEYVDYLVNFRLASTDYATEKTKPAIFGGLCQQAKEQHMSPSRSALLCLSLCATAGDTQS